MLKLHQLIFSEMDYIEAYRKLITLHQYPNQRKILFYFLISANMFIRLYFLNKGVIYES